MINLFRGYVRLAQRARHGLLAEFQGQLDVGVVGPAERVELGVVGQRQHQVAALHPGGRVEAPQQVLVTAGQPGERLGDLRLFIAVIRQNGLYSRDMHTPLLPLRGPG